MGSDRILFTVGSGLMIRGFTCKDHRIILAKLPDNGAIDISAREELGHVTEQPEDEGGQLRLVHHCRAPSYQGPLELRHLEKTMIIMMMIMMMGVITWCSSQPSIPWAQTLVLAVILPSANRSLSSLKPTATSPFSA